MEKGQIKILVMDDQAAHAFWLREWLIQNGFAAYDVQSVEDAKIFLDEEWPDVVIFDAIVPQDNVRIDASDDETFLGGLAVLAWLQIQKKMIPELIIVMSNLMSDSIEKKFRSYGAHYAIAKPFEPSELLRIIYKHFKSKGV